MDPLNKTKFEKQVGLVDECNVGFCIKVIDYM